MNATTATGARDDDRHRAAFSLDLLGPRYWPIWIALFFIYLLSWLPVRVMDALGTLGGRVALRHGHRRLHFARRNLQMVFPHKSDAEIHALLREFICAQMRSLLHLPLIWAAPDWRLRGFIDTEGFEQLRLWRERGRNVIALTAHSVGLEFSVIALTMHGPAAGPYKPGRNKLMDWLISHGRQRYGGVPYTRDAGFRPLIRHVRNGCTLVYLADEDLGPEVSVFAPFMGVQKATVRVLGRLAKRCDAVVLPCSSHYDRKRARYRVRLWPALADFPTGDDVEDATRMNAAMEETVREYPEQYFWTLRLFKTRPGGAASPYADIGREPRPL